LRYTSFGILLSVFRFTVYDFPFGIFKLFLLGLGSELRVRLSQVNIHIFLEGISQNQNLHPTTGLLILYLSNAGDINQLFCIAFCQP
jgi:hypothetical protein